jgi:hypothetical protein
MELPTYIIAKTKNKPHVCPNWSWFGPIATQFKSILPPLMEHVWRNKKIVSKGWKFTLLPRWNEFGPKSEKNLKFTFLFCQSGFGLLEIDNRMYEGQW